MRGKPRGYRRFDYSDLIMTVCLWLMGLGLLADVVLAILKATNLCPWITW